MSSVKLFASVSALILIALTGFYGEVFGGTTDKENCLMCHKYRFMGRIDEEGKTRIFNVDEHVFSQTVHRHVACRDCHTYINTLPHAPVTEEVSCANQCHIKPPFSDDYFSHKKIIKVFESSVHYRKPGDPPELNAAKPYCKYCHTNPLYTKAEEGQIASGTVKRCQNCHQEEGVTMAWKHVTHRLRKKTSRSSKEIVELCTRNCHGDVAKMTRFNVSPESLEAAETYRLSIHGKAVELGSKKAPNCVTCHASSVIHDIYKKDNIRSWIHEENRVTTCKQCHKAANKHFTKIDPHFKITRKETPFLWFVNLNLTFALWATTLGLCGLMFLENFRRMRLGIKFQIRKGTSWRGKRVPPLKHFEQ